MAVAEGEDVIAEGIDRFETFLRQIGVPTSLKELDIAEDEIAGILDDVVKVSFGADGNLACNPLMSRDDIEQVLIASMGLAPCTTD